jgi:NRPS condensation-like uncharacterized protein
MGKVWYKTATADLRIHELYSTLPSNSNEKPVFTDKIIMSSKTTFNDTNRYKSTDKQAEETGTSQTQICPWSVECVKIQRP